MTDSLPSDFIADGQPFENPEASADTAYAATVPSLGSKLAADFGEGLTAAIGRAGQRGQQQGASWFDRLATMPDVDTAAGMVAGGQDPYPEPTPSPTISADEANKRFAPPGTTIADGPMSEGLARVVGQQKADEVQRDSVLSRYAAGHGTLTNLGVGLALSPLMDPVGSAAMFVPGIGEEALAAHLGEGLVARTAARVGAGASAGAIGMGVAAAGKYALGTEQDSDYTLRSAMYDMAGGAALGALGHAGFGALREAGILKPDGLMAAESARAAAGLQPAEAPTGLVSNEDLGAVVDAPASARFDALHAGVAQTLDGREVDVAPIFDQVRADRAEADLQRWTAQQGRLDAQSTAALQASSLSDAAAGTVESRATVLQKRLDDLRGQHAGFLADIDDATARQAAQVDTVTPQRLQAIDAELSDSAIPASRRADLENERSLLTEGRDPAADALEAARTTAELQGLQRGAAAVQSEMDRTAGRMEPLQATAAAQRAAGSDALGTVSDRIAAQEGTLRSLAARSIRRYAGAFGADVTRDEADALALRTLRGGPDEVAKVVAEIRGRVAPSAARAPQPAAPLAGPPIEQQRAAIANDVARQLVAAGRPEREARAHGRVVAAHYEARASRFGGALGTAEDLYRDRAAEIRGPDAATTPTTAPTGGDDASGGAAIPRVYDRASITSRFSDDQGRLDMARASDAVRAKIGAALDQGQPVTYHVEGRSIPIVSADGGRLVDDKGQAWGLFQILQPRPGDANRIEVGAPREGMLAEPAEPMQAVHRLPDVESAANEPEIAPGEPAAPPPEAVEDRAAAAMPEAVEPVRAAVVARDAVDVVPEVGQPAPLPVYSPEAGVAAAPRGKDQPAGVFMFDPVSLAVDAERFQFKAGGDAYGVTGALRGVTRWDPAKAQALMVFEQADGRLFVADGHQRAGLARRLTESGDASGLQLPGILYREADGVSAADMRAMAAVTNIANGSGSALDGAKVLRARPDLMDGSVPLSAGKGQQAAALARLDDEAFRMVVNDVVSDHFGAVVGQVIPSDGPRQVAALKAIARFEPRSVEEATALTQRVASAELARAEEGRQASLFGDLDAPESTAGDEMRIVARVIRDLRRDRGLFSRVVANASRLEEAGSTIERGAARSAATDAGAFAKVLSSDAYTAGPTRTVLLDAAKDLQNGRATIGDASARLYAAIRRQAEENGLDRSGARLGDAAPEGDAVRLDGTRDNGGSGRGRNAAGASDIDAPRGRAADDAAVRPGGGAGDGSGVGDRAGGRSGRQGRQDAASAARRGDRRAAARDGLGDLLGRLAGDDVASRVVPLDDRILDRGAAGEASIVDQMNELLGRKPTDAPVSAALADDADAAPRAASGVHPDLIPAGRYVVRRDVGKPGSRGYSIHPMPEGGLAGVQPRDLGDPLGFTSLSERPDGRHEVGLVSVEPEYRRQGLARAMYDAIEGELGARMQPSGHLLPDGYAMWKARDPEAVKWHREIEGDYLSPRKLLETAEELGPDEGQDYREAFDALPPEAKTPEALATMFQRRGGEDLGSITFRAGERPLLRLMADADASTFVHEMGHDWLEQMMRDAEHPAAPDAFRADAQAVRGWLGSDGGALTAEQHEHFATGFEQYLRAGEAPAPELAGVFAQLKDWLTRIYRTVAGLGAEISPEIRDVFDRLLTAEPDRPAPQPPARPDVAALAQRQQAIYRGGFAPGMPQGEFDALNEAVYGAKASAGDGAAVQRQSDAAGAAGQAPKTAADALLATWQQRFDAAGVVPTAEERALIDATRARVEAADLSAEGYAQAGACLTAAGI